MNWRIIQLGDERTIAFAVDELNSYLRRLDKAAQVGIVLSSGERLDYSPGLSVGVSKDTLLDAADDPVLDDAILIDVDCNGVGVIGGSNPRAVLIGVYRYLRELGCRFIHPGENGAIIPALECRRAICVREKASYRHRGVCIEGCNAYHHVSDLIAWLPKLGLNSYFTQFRSPYGFMNKWYSHDDNKSLHVEEFTQSDALGMMHRYESEIKKRGLLYHAAGHGWQCEPFGVNIYTWKRGVDKPGPEYKPYLSVLKGERQLFGWSPDSTTPGDTQLCYSQAIVREKITEAITEYCAARPEIDYVHFWLADGMDNHCECDDCAKLRPSDWYVMMLNLLDEKLASRKLKTRIVFLIYVDLLWEPQRERLRSQDRFVLMFAPITRHFSKSFSLGASSDPDRLELPPYVRNKLSFPLTVEANVAHLRRWQRAFSGDSFDYDYHAVGAHFADPGLNEISRVMGEDMGSLRDIGLNGMISCQLQRIFFPSGILMHVMAQRLWSRDLDLELLLDSFYRDAYGDEGPDLKEYLEQLSGLFDIGFIRNEKKNEDLKKHFAMLRKAIALIRGFRQTIDRNVVRMAAAGDTVRCELWKLLRVHSRISKGQAELLILGLRGDSSGASAKADEIAAYVNSIELETQSVLDASRVISSLNTLVKKQIPAILASAAGGKEKK